MVRERVISFLSQHLVMSQYADSWEAWEGRFKLKLSFRPHYAELMHPRPQSTRMETQDRRGPVLPVDAPSGFDKGSEDLLSLHLLQGSRDGWQ